MLRLIMLPGLGADGRMFEPQRTAFPQLEVPARLPAIAGESVADHARRLMPTLGLEPGDRESQAGGEPDPFDAARREPRFPRAARQAARPSAAPYVLCGVSIGGMIAQELARLAPPAALILIATARAGRQVPRYFRFYEWLTRPLPDRVLRSGRFLQPLISRRFSGVNPEQERLITQMVNDTPLDYIRWGARAIFEWPGCARQPACPTWHIHGAADRLIPPAGIAPPPDRQVAGGGHLINMTHVEEVNGFIAACLTIGPRG